MPTIVTTSSAADFLAVVPHLVGFQPENSIVFVAFRGRRTCGAMRFDLPETHAPTHGRGPADDAESKFYKRVATTLVGMLSKLQGVDAVVPVVYTSETFSPGPAPGPAPESETGLESGGPPRATFVRAVIARFEFSGFNVRDALCVAEDGWGSYFDGACPSGGRSLAAITQSRIFEGLTAEQFRPLGDVAEWAALPEVDAGDRELVERCVSDFCTVIHGRILVSAGYWRGGEDESLEEALDAYADDDLEDTEGIADALLLREIPNVLERIFDRGDKLLEVESAAFVISLARLPAIRDVVMLQGAFDISTGRRVLDDARSFALGAPAHELGSGVLMLGQGPRPDPERVDRAIELLKRVAALAPRENQPPVFAMLAWLNWALGRSSVARIFVAAADEIDAGYGFADLMRTVLERGMLPEWAFESER